MQVNGANSRYPNLLLGNFGIFCSVNENRKIEVVFPKLTSEGDVEYIYSWHDLQSIHIPTLRKANTQSRINFRTAQEIAFLIREHIQFVEPEILNLKKQRYKINKLLDLIAKSEFYESQQEIYERALFQLEKLPNKAEELQRVYLRLIKEILINKKIAEYDLNSLPKNSFAIDNKYKVIKTEYQNMKDTATAYGELLNAAKSSLSR